MHFWQMCYVGEVLLARLGARSFMSLLVSTPASRSPARQGGQSEERPNRVALNSSSCGAAHKKPTGLFSFAGQGIAEAFAHAVASEGLVG